MDVIRMMTRALEERGKLIVPPGEMPSVKEVQTIGGE